MSNSIGKLRVDLGMDDRELRRKMNDVSARVKEFGRGLQSIGTKMSAAVTMPLIALAGKSVAAQREQEQAIAAVSAALTSMGDGAGYTLSQLEDMASALQSKSLYGDQEILSKVTANLLTFGNIHTDVFERAQQLSLDLSARLGTDLQSSAIMLGKALNDPVQGLSALGEAGVSFTEQQKEQIRAMALAGNVAGAQAVMLAELEKQYAGQAEALANTDSGKITQAWNAIGNAMEKIGAVNLPALAEFAGHVQRLAEKFSALDPETQKFVVIAGAIAAALGPVLIGLGLMVSAMAPLVGLVLTVVSPLGLLAAAIATVGTAIYANWDTLKEKFPESTAAVEAGLSNLGEAYGVQAAAMKESGSQLASAFESLLSGDFVGALGQIGTSVETMKASVLPTIDALLGQMDEKVIAWAKGLPGKLKTGFDDAVQAVRDFSADMLAAMQTLATDMWNEALAIGKNIVDGIKAGIKEKWESLKAYFHELAMGLPEWVRKPLGIHSPSRVFAKIGHDITEGLVQGLAAGQGAVQGAMTSLAGEIESVGSAMEGVGEKSASTFGSIGRLIGESIKGAKSLTEALGNVLAAIGQVLIKQAAMALADSGTGFGKFFSDVLGGLFGFANGGSFQVGGAGGIDSQVVAFRASPNETVHVTKPGQGAGAGMQLVYAPVINAPGADAAAVAGIREQMARDRAEFPAAVLATVRKAQKSRML